jgi:hypothetical protein
MRPWCDQERTSWAAACGPTPGWSLWRELTNDRLYLARELAALLMNENIDPARQRSTRRSSQP